MKQTPTLSIILPVYNAASYLEAAFCSLKRQTLTDFEVLCINDRSTDDSLMRLKRQAARDARFVVIDSPKNLGAGGARNLGLAAASGQYITFLDADDTLEPTLYARAVCFAEATGADEVVYGLTEEHYDRRERHLRSVPIAPPTAVYRTEADRMTAFLELERTTLFGYQWNSVYRAELIRRHNIRFERALFYEDFFFNLAVAERVQVLATLHDTGYHYFKRQNQSVTHRFTKDYFALSYRRIAELVAFLERRRFLTGYACDLLGGRLLRYTLSALCRNTDPRADMTFRTRKRWFLACCDRALFGRLLPASRPAHPAFFVLKRSILQKKAFPALSLGRLVAWLR